MRIIVLLIVLIVCMCGNNYKSSEVNVLKGKIKNGILTEGEFNKFLRMKGFNENQMIEIINDTDIKDAFRKSALNYLFEKYYYINMSLGKCKEQFKFVVWLNKGDLKILRSYVGPPSFYFKNDTTGGLASFFQNDTTSGIVVSIMPKYSQSQKSRICFKIGINNSYKGAPITEELLFSYFKAEHNSYQFDVLPIIKMKILNSYWY